MQMRRKHLSRRDALKGLSLASVAFAAPLTAPSAATRAAPAGFATPAELLTNLVKMRGSLDERLVFIWLKGLRYTLVDGEALPLCGYLGGSITRYRQLAEDMFEFLLYEVSYYTDLESGEVLETLRMPYTDREVAVPLYRTGPGRHVIMMANEEELDWSRERTTSEELAKQIAPDAKVFYRLNVRPAFSFGNKVWIRNDTFTRLVPNDPSQPGMFYKEAITYQGERAELERPGAAQVDTSIAFAIATAWRPWMQMAGMAGHTVTDGVGGKVLDILDMPQDFVRFTEQHHPDVLENPAALLQT